MSEKKIMAVVGATGAQGGGRSAPWFATRVVVSLRALTRDVNSDKAKELAKLGAEVVATDVDDVDSLKRASKGAYGAFCVTFFWAHFSPEKELAQATAMANAAKHAEARHLVHAGRHTPVGSTEALQLMKAIWTTDPVEFNGKYYQIPRSYIGPKPIQNF